MSKQKLYKLKNKNGVKMDENYVVNQPQVLKNFKTLISYRNNRKNRLAEYYKHKLKSGKTFILEIINGNIEFAPSKFVGYKNNTFQLHDKHYAIDRSGHLTDQNFRKIYGKRLESSSFLDSVLDSFYKLHNINGTPYKPKAHIHYFILPETLEQVKKTFSEIPEFFLTTDIVRYSKYAGKPYRKNNPEDVKIGQEIREKLYDKTNYWLESISVPGYVKETNTMWQIMGVYSAYTWGKAFKQKDKDRLIYFTVGIDYSRTALIYKLDCQRSRPSGGIKLTKEQVSKFDNFIAGSGSEWIEINLDEIKKLNWATLINNTNNFISKYDKLYEDAIKYVWGKGKIKQPKNSLEEVDPPDPKILLPIIHTFKGYKTDHIKRQRESKKLGLAGELLVIEFEKNRLKDLLKPGMKIEHISREKGDGTGYDVKSYDEFGNEIFIEIKTTKSKDKDTQFNISPTELEFSKLKNKSYWLYRVFNFDKKNNTGNLYRINGNLFKVLDMYPDSYVAVFKGTAI
ncbi:MAG: DUF3883 domain-containing protein [Ignavibacterium sp.]|nr:DUF3883 domain-containing protein [Ignavibacterium sp.]